MRYVDVLAAAFFFQFTLYVAIRLAHRGFSLGELGLVAFGATVLFAEMVDLTAARVRGPFPSPPIEQHPSDPAHLRYGRQPSPSSRLSGFQRRF